MDTRRLGGGEPRENGRRRAGLDEAIYVPLFSLSAPAGVSCIFLLRVIDGATSTAARRGHVLPKSTLSIIATHTTTIGVGHHHSLATFQASTYIQTPAAIEHLSEPDVPGHPPLAPKPNRVVF